MAKQSESLRFHNVHSDRYTKMIGGASDRIGAAMLKDISPSITPDSYILDNACGPAIITKIIKDIVPEARIVAADLTPGMLDQVKARAEMFHWSNIETELLDMRELKTLKDNSFSHSFTSLGLQALTAASDGPLKACKELYRVAQPGGICSISTWSERSFPNALMAVTRRIRPQQEPINKMEMPQGWDRGSWLMALMEDAGFGDQVIVKPCPTYNEAESMEALVESLMTFQAFFFPDFSPEELSKVEELLKEELLKLPGFEVVGDGRVRMPMTALVGFGWK